jgi:hypothetical protein
MLNCSSSDIIIIVKIQKKLILITKFLIFLKILLKRKTKCIKNDISLNFKFFYLKLFFYFLSCFDVLLLKIYFLK